MKLSIFSAYSIYESLKLTRVSKPPHSVPMASKPDDLKGGGSFILTAKVSTCTIPGLNALSYVLTHDIFVAHPIQLVPKPGKTDELAQWLSNLKKRADSDAEPGTLQYNVVRFEDHVRVWEE